MNNNQIFNLDDKNDMGRFLKMLEEVYSLEFIFKTLEPVTVGILFEDYEIEDLEKVSEKFTKCEMYEYAKEIQDLILRKIKLSNLL
jgi:uncharacterized protein (DUF169 family)